MENFIGQDYADLGNREQFIRDNCTKCEEKSYMKPFSADELSQIKESLVTTTIEISKVEEERQNMKAQIKAMSDNINLNAAESASQKQRILEHLMEGKSITPLEALKRFGCFRLGARIWDLIHKDGYAIKAEYVRTESGKKVMSYSLRR
jgi:primase-polymerase (primpol)-like protein